MTVGAPSTWNVGIDMRPPNVALIVGNGLSMSLQAWLRPALDLWPTDRPLAWNLPHIPDGPSSSMEAFPVLFDFILTERAATTTGLSDFELFGRIPDTVAELKRKAAEPQNAWPNKGWVDLEKRASALSRESRHFLCIAFSNYQATVDELDLSEWEWFEWVRRHRELIGCVISYNYDLLVERALTAAQLPIRSPAVENDPTVGVPLIKPHGSIDFAPARNIISAPVGYPLRGGIERLNAPLHRLATSEILTARHTADLILPNEFSYAREYQWVGPGYEGFERGQGTITHSIFAGLSFSPWDREELTFLVSAIADNATIVIINPRPDRDFIELAKNGVRTVAIWDRPMPLTALWTSGTA